MVVAAHKEDLGWLKTIGHPTLVYRRAATPHGLYVTPNVFHEHAVYLRCDLPSSYPPPTLYPLPSTPYPRPRTSALPPSRAPCTCPRARPCMGCRYICAFYTQLPKLSVFLHGHYTSWHNGGHRSPPAATQLQSMDLHAAAAANVSVYRSFNDYAECWRDSDGAWEAELAAQAHGWRREMAAHVGQPPRLTESYCCTQFIVSADRIRARPLKFWRTLLADLLDSTVPPVCKVSGHLLELTWGYMLGEPSTATCRKDGWGAGSAGGGPARGAVVGRSSGRSRRQGRGRARGGPRRRTGDGRRG